jgi:hypothetical protein
MEFLKENIEVLTQVPMVVITLYFFYRVFQILDKIIDKLIDRK